MAFEILHGLLMFFSRGFGRKRAEIFSFARLRIFLTRIQPILAGF
jgi:hypothetical protein